MGFKAPCAYTSHTFTYMAPRAYTSHTSTYKAPRAYTSHTSTYTQAETFLPVSMLGAFLREWLCAIRWMEGDKAWPLHLFLLFSAIRTSLLWQWFALQRPWEHGLQGMQASLMSSAEASRKPMLPTDRRLNHARYNSALALQVSPALSTGDTVKTSLRL